MSANDKAKGPSRRRFIKTSAAVGAVAAGGLPLFNINHAWSQDVTYDGGVFDAGGATFRLAEWPGFWQENITELLLNDFFRLYGVYQIGEV